MMSCRRTGEDGRFGTASPGEPRVFMAMLDGLRKRVTHLKGETFALYLAARHPATPWYAKVFVAGVVAYAFSPIDLIPDFVPVAGQLDDAVLVAFVLRRVVQANPTLVQEHWPGPSSSLALLLRLVGSLDRVAAP